MNSRVPWSIEGIDPSVRERAEAAARRAGMSLSDWLNSTLGSANPPDFRNPGAALPQGGQWAPDVDDIHQRLDAITRQIDQISRPAARNEGRSEAPRNDTGGARQLNDAIARLDARLSQISNPSRPSATAAAPRDGLEPEQRTDRVERAAAQVYPSSANPDSLDFAISEIAARQSELDGSLSRAPRPMPLSEKAMRAPAPAASTGPDLSSLQEHLIKITGQIEALQRPDRVDESIAAFRNELAEIRNAIVEAMPRRAIETIESEIRALSRRIDDTRQNGIDGRALAGIENALGEIREVLRSLTPAEQLAGYDEAIRNLGAKLDMILRANDDPGTVHQLEGAIAALRAIVSNVASNDALARLSDDVRTLAARVDQLARPEASSDAFSALEQRMAALTASLDRQEPQAGGQHSQQLDETLRALSERLDRLPVSQDSASAFNHLEQRISYLLERLESSAAPATANLGRVEEGLQDILRHLSLQQEKISALAETRRDPPPPESGLFDMVRRELSDLRFSHSETERHTQDSLEAVHNTLGHVVDRLAMIEGDLRNARPTSPLPPSGPSGGVPRGSAQAQAQAKPELPNPAAAQEHFVRAPRDFRPADPQASAVPEAISEILEPRTPAARGVIVPDLPPDHPLEPGTRPATRPASPSERIAASESAIADIPPAPAAPVNPASASSFIAAARRAAQAAAALPADKPVSKASKEAKKESNATDKAGSAKEQSTISSKIRSLLVGASVVVIVLGSFKMALSFLDGGSLLTIPGLESPSQPQQPAAAPPPDRDSAAPAPAAPTMMSPAPTGRQSLNSTAPGNAAPADTAPSQADVATAPAEQPPQPAAVPPAADVTGSIPQPTPLAASQPLPDSLGGPLLRTAALKGDPAAAYEVGVRFAEGKGVPVNLEEAAKWYQRAAQAGIIPAIFRLGTLYEKGLAVKKDVDVARSYYTQAAERGNAKAMHNLAVLYADGGGKGADFKSAAQWFRKAADHGIADSQFNLGILYARGIGVEQNLAESFKWFSLAAAQGDSDATRKRDDVAKRLDPQSLAAAKLAIQTFTVDPQPHDAVNVPAPAGGWDGKASAAPGKAVAKSPLGKRAVAKS